MSDHPPKRPRGNQLAGASDATLIIQGPLHSRTISNYLLNRQHFEHIIVSTWEPGDDASYGRLEELRRAIGDASSVRGSATVVTSPVPTPRKERITPQTSTCRRPAPCSALSGWRLRTS